MPDEHQDPPELGQGTNGSVGRMKGLLEEVAEEQQKKANECGAAIDKVLHHFDCHMETDSFITSDGRIGANIVVRPKNPS